MEECSFNYTFLEDTYPAYYIKSLEKASDVLTKAMSIDTVFAIDTETMANPIYVNTPEPGLSPHRGWIRLIQIFSGRSILVLDMYEYYDRADRDPHLDILIKFLSSKKFIAHNALFDLKFFKQLGVKHMQVGCTMLLAKVLMHAIYATDEGLSYSLKALADSLFGEGVLKHVQKSDWSKRDLTFEQIEYAASDPVVCYRIAEKLAPGLAKFGLLDYYNLIKEAQLPIAELELNGIKLNTTRHREMIDVWRDTLFAAKKKLFKITGLDSITSHKIAKYLETKLDAREKANWPATEKGKLKTDINTLKEHAYLEVVAPFASYQKMDKLTSTFGQALINCTDDATKRVHASFRLCGARTGRLSSSSPNLQQLPREAAEDTLNIRESFIAEPGYKLLCADYSQIELRVAAELSQDLVMLNAFKKGIDLHALTAATVAGKQLENVTKEERQKAKALNFGLLFGLGVDKYIQYAKLSYGVNVTYDEADASIRTWRELYARYREYQLAQAMEGETTLRVRTPIGKLRALEPGNTYGTAMNHPVQGGAAECMLFALIALNKMFTDNNLDARLVNCVHDEVVVEAHESIIEDVKHCIETAMTAGFLRVFPDGITRGIVEVGVGHSWAEAKKK